MSGVYSLSTTVDVSFILPKLDLNFPNSIFCSRWKTVQLFIALSCHLSFLKLLYKSVLLSIVKVPYKSVLLSIITCHHLLLTCHTQKYFTKAFYYLGKTWLCVINVTYHFQKRIVFYYVKFSTGIWNKQEVKPTQKQAFCKTCCELKKHSAYIKLGLTQQSLTILKIGELLIKANSPNLSDLTV